MGEVTVLVGHDWVVRGNVVADARSEDGMVIDTMLSNGSYSWYKAAKSTTAAIEYISELLGKSATDHCASVLA